MTNPGVQNPHCEACALTIELCAGCNVPSLLMMSSTLQTACPLTEWAIRMQLLTAVYTSSLFCSCATTTVHAPQSPSAQPSLVPLEFKSSLRICKSVLEGAIFSSVISLPFLQKRRTCGWLVSLDLPEMLFLLKVIRGQ